MIGVAECAYWLSCTITEMAPMTAGPKHTSSVNTTTAIAASSIHASTRTGSVRRR
jgi:hypothetical protein